jgi:phage-related protein
VASIVGKVIAFVIRAFANLLLGFGTLIDINNTFGKVVAAVFQFVYDTVINVFLGISKGIKFLLDAYVSLMENNDYLRKVVVEVFNTILRIIALAVTQIVVSFANILKAIASGIYIFEKFLDISKTIVKGVIAAFALLGKGVFNIFKTLGSGIGDFLNNAFNITAYK